MPNVQDMMEGGYCGCWVWWNYNTLLYMKFKIVGPNFEHQEYCGFLSFRFSALFIACNANKVVKTYCSILFFCCRLFLPSSSSTDAKLASLYKAQCRMCLTCINTPFVETNFRILKELLALASNINILYIAFWFTLCSDAFYYWPRNWGGPCFVRNMFYPNPEYFSVLSFWLPSWTNCVASHLGFKKRVCTGC